MATAVLALIGTIIGALAAVGGTMYAARQEQKRDEAARLVEVRTATRAWREDFYSFQKSLAEVVEYGTWPNVVEAPLLGGTENLMILAAAMDGDQDWSIVTSVRRRIHAAQARRDAGQQISREDAAGLFNRIEEGRKALASTDKAWRYKPHPRANVIAQSRAQHQYETEPSVEGGK